MKYSLFLLLLFCCHFCFSQIYDDFSDGNFNDNPVWNGSNSGGDFIINNNRLRSNSSKLSGNFYLSTPNSLALGCYWEFWLNLQFSTSGSNYVDVYLISDKTDLQSTLINGYFVRIGNTEDEISLYKRSGSTGTSTRIIDGINGSVGSSNNTVKIRVSRSNSGLFSLDRELISPNSKSFNEGTFLDTNHTFSASFGILIQQSTASFFQKHFFDDFTVAALKTDSIAPTLTMVSVIDSTTLAISFSEAMDSVSAKNKMNYSISNFSGEITQIFTESDPEKYKIRLSKSLTTGNFTLTVLNVSDRSGNKIKSHNSRTFSYLKPYDGNLGDITINEIFPDPSPQIDLPSVEYVELYNSSGKTISLKNWKFSDQTSSANLEDINLEAGAYLILCAKTDTNEFKKFGKVLGISPWPSLNNTNDIITLKNTKNIVIDSLSYSSQWHRTEEKRQGGWSLEKIDQKSICEGLFNWTSSTDSTGGTPGKANAVNIINNDSSALKADSINKLSDTTLLVYFNKHLDKSTIQTKSFSLTPSAGSIKNISPDTEFKQVKITFNEKFSQGQIYLLKITGIRDCSGNSILNGFDGLNFSLPIVPPKPVEKPDTAKIYITEIFADPSPEVGLPLVEFVEIHNPGKDTINLDAWSLNDTQSRGNLKRSLLAPGEFLILCPLADTSQYQAFGKTAGISPWPSLGNSSDRLSLKSHKGRTVDSVAYSDSWYKNPGKRSGGWSLEKIIKYDDQCPGFYNWVASSDPSGGTPGKSNSKNTFPGNSELKIDSIQVLSDTSVVIRFSSIPDTSYLKASNFNIPEKIGRPKSLKSQADFLGVQLNFSTKFNEGTEYSILADSLYSCSGKLSSTTNRKVSFQIPSVPENDYPLIISEIFADPSPTKGLPEAEFVELFNTTSVSVNLQGLNFGDQTQNYTFKHGEIAGHSYLILCPEKDTLLFRAYGKVIGLPVWPDLNNETDLLVLKNNKGREIHIIRYDSKWYRDLEKSKGGYSLELIDPESVCVNSQNWKASLDSSGGTPGKINSVALKDYKPELLKLIGLELIDSLRISLSFNRSVDSLQASNKANFSVNNGVGNPLNCQAEGPDLDRLTLTFMEPLSRGYTYRLSVSNINDCKGIMISPEFNSLEFRISRKINKNDMLITEILFNPRPGGADFVEIYNNTDFTLDLKELSIARIFKDSVNSIQALSKKQRFIEPGNYLALTADPANIKKEYNIRDTSSMLKINSLPAFNDDAGTAVLLSNGQRIDQLSYSEKMHFQLLKITEGVSLERSSLKRPNNDPGNLRSATAAAGFATPGTKNSQHAEDPILKENISFTTKTFSPDHDGFEDLLEINYQFPVPGKIASLSIYTIQGVLVKRLIQNYVLNKAGSFIWDGLNEQGQALPGGVYMMLAEVFDTSGQISRFSKPFVLAVKFK